MVGRKKGEWWDKLGQMGRLVAVEAVKLYSDSQARNGNGQTKRARNSICPMRNVFVWCVLELYGVHVTQGDATAFVRYLTRTDGELLCSKPNGVLNSICPLPPIPATNWESQLQVSVDIIQDGSSLSMFRYEIDPLLQVAPFLFDVKLENRHPRTARITYDTVWTLVPNSQLKVETTSTNRPGVISTTLVRNSDKDARGHYFDIPRQELKAHLEPTVSFFRLKHYISLSGNAILLNNLLSTAFGYFPFFTGIQVTYNWLRAASDNLQPSQSVPSGATIPLGSPLTERQDVLPPGADGGETHTAFTSCSSSFVPSQIQPAHERCMPVHTASMPVEEKDYSIWQYADEGQNGNPRFPESVFRVPFHEGVALQFVPAEDGGLIAALHGY